MLCRPLLIAFISAISLYAHVDLLIPAETTAGTPGFTLRALGTDYASGEFLLWNGTPLNTTFISEEELQAFVPASLLLTPGPVTVTLSGFNSVRFTINPAPVISTASPLAPGTPGTSYTQALNRTGGTSPFRWDIVTGTALPGGLSLDPNTGIITGTPQSEGTFNFTARVTDKLNVSATKAFTLVSGQPASGAPSCVVTPQNLFLSTHHPTAHTDPRFQTPDHLLRVVVTAGSTPIAGVAVSVNATQKLFVSDSTDATATTNADGIATFIINPPASEGFDRTDIIATFIRNGTSHRCKSTVLVGLGLLSSIRERLSATHEAALARLKGNYRTGYNRFFAELQDIVNAHPELESDALWVVENMEPRLQAVLSGDPVNVRAGELARLERLIARVKVHASPELRTALVAWKRDLYRAKAKVKFDAPPTWTPPAFAIGHPPSPARNSRRLSFEANAGQAGKQVSYLARGAVHHAWFTTDGVILRSAIADNVRLRFHGVNSNRLAKPQPLEPTGSVTHYLAGNDPRAWRTGIPHYDRLKYSNVFPGTDLIFYGDEGQLRYDFVLSPRANPSRIALSFDGVREVEPLASGELALHFSGGAVRLGVPYAYQVHEGGKQHAIPARYQSRGGNRIGFELAKYDPALPVIIDPVISYATFAGGAGEDAALAIKADAQGSAYVAGFSGTTDVQAFVTKFSPDGSRILFTTYFGGTGVDLATGLAIDPAGNIYVCGSTSSSDFPVANGFRMTYGGGPADLMADGFIVKINPAGDAITYASYIGGSGADTAKGIAVDATGSAYVTGSTASLDFPVANALQATNRGGTYGKTDAFVMKVNPSGNARTYATYLGGTGDDSGLAIAIDATGNAYITGTTHSADFPTVNPYQPARRSEADAYIAKINPAGSALVYSTYFGGSSDDSGTSIAVDQTGAAYIAGITGSGNLPVINAAQSKPGSPDGLGFDAFAAKISPAGNTLAYSTFLGGSGVELAHGIAVDTIGAAYVVGETGSSDYPVSNPMRLAGSGTDSFVTKLAPSGSTIEYSSYLGGQAIDAATAVAIDSAGNAYVAGSTASIDHAATPGAARTLLAGRTDAFTIKIMPGTTPPLVQSMSAASLLRGAPVSPDSIVTAIGLSLAVREEFSEYPQPVVGGAAVEIVDGSGITHRADIYSASPARIDFVLPAATASGVAEVRVQRDGQTVAAGTVRVAAIAPAIFTENGRGSGPPRGWAIRTEADGTETVLPLGQCGSANPDCEPLELDMSSGPITLTLLSTGIRHRTALESVTAAANGIEIPIVSAGAQGDFPGYDQLVTGPLPEALRGHGIVDFIVFVEGEKANPVRIRVR
jgi:uncharacterized protein (TIGR03437 family)